MEQQIADVHAEISHTKQEILEVKEQLRTADGDKEKLLLERLNTLAERLNTLQQQKLELLKLELLQQSATAGAAGGLTKSELEDAVSTAVLHAFKRAKSDQVSISAFNMAHWGHMSQQAGLGLVMCPPNQLSVEDDQEAKRLSLFSWSDAPEPGQADRYMPYIKELIGLCERTDYPLVLLEVGNKHKNLLGLHGYDSSLYYSTITGNTDAAIITRHSYDAKSLREGLCVLFELKKVVEGDAVYQAACELVLASILSPSWRPVVVLTDLRQHWQLFWMNGMDVTHALLPSRAAAVAVIKGCVQQAAAGARGSEMSAPPSLPQVLADRKEVNIVRNILAATGTAMAVNPNLLDLQDMLSAEDMQDVYAQVMLRQVSMLPVFSTMRCKDAAASMFS